MWLKYDSAPILLGHQWSRNQTGRMSEYEKPRGFWITDDSEDCWRSWCVSERFGLEDLTHKHEIILDESNILILRNVDEVEDFARNNHVLNPWGPDNDPQRWTAFCINWPEVAKRHAGIIITPYQWSLRMAHNFNWYYTWDCASGCIWDVSAIRDIRLLEIDHDIASPRESVAA